MMGPYPEVEPRDRKLDWFPPHRRLIDGRKRSVRQLSPKIRRVVTWHYSGRKRSDFTHQVMYKAKYVDIVKKQ